MRLPAAGPAVALLLAAGCSPTAPAHDIGFVRGCWVEKTAPGGTVVSFLRLLPDRDGAPALTGVLDFVELLAGDGVSGDERDDLALMLALDGSFLTTGIARESGYFDQQTKDDTPPIRWKAADIPPLAEDQRQPGESLAAFRQNDGQWIIVAGASEHLAIYTLHSDGGMDNTLFYGERDGCD